MEDNKKPYKKYISYFQRVTTIGIRTCAKSYEDAEEQAKEKLRVSDLSYVHFEQTPLELSDTEEWKPDFEIVSEDPTPDGEAIEWTMNISEDMKSVIADRVGVHPDNITREHIEGFISDGLNYVINAHEGKGGIDGQGR